MRTSVTILGAAALVAAAALFVGAGDAAEPKALGELPLTQSFRFPTGLKSKTTITLPPSAGVALTEVHVTHTEGTIVTLTVNGVELFKGTIGVEHNWSKPSARFDPPILVPPGGTLVVELNRVRSAVLAGYYLKLSDLGL